MTRAWRPSVGAWSGEDGVHFRVWAPDATTVELVLESRPGQEPIAMQPSAEGLFETTVAYALPGTRYRYRIDGAGPFPDPASRFQPEGVHGPSEVIDSGAFAWTDDGWSGPAPDGAIVYELHVGTFTREGTFAAAAKKLPALAELGVTAIELMPLADFPGRRGWGYDGVSLYAPARCYGRPDDLRRFVDAAHNLNLSVLVDAVYNHLGPDGNYLSAFSPYYFSKSRQTDWGTGPNFDGDRSERAVDFFIENALHWIHEYRVDGLRLDATHAITDDSERHFLERLAERVHAAGAALGRRVFVIAEDERNFATIVRSRAAGGYGLDGVWADDFHHQIRRALTGQSDGYYADYAGTADDIAATIRNGWFYRGQPTVRTGKPRGSDPSGLAASSFITCIQNHDQVGNRAFGERLNHQVDPSAYRAASVLLLLAPQTPLLFMGQEWAASAPFLYFTDHNTELGALVTEGRRREFGHFAAFADPRIRTSIPDPQADSTFLASKLDWAEMEREPHAGTRLLYRDLIRLRKFEPALELDGTCEATAIADGTVLLRRVARSGEAAILALVALKPGAVAAVNEPGWSLALTTEDDSYTPNPRRPGVSFDDSGLVVHFPCPAAVVFRRVPDPLERGPHA
jgi:maltooligosyltrehalose trehalohydrolase